MNQHYSDMNESCGRIRLYFHSASQPTSTKFTFYCLVIALSLVFLTGCTSTTYSHKIKGWGDLKTLSGEFDPPLVVMAPELKIKTAWWGGAFGNMREYDNPCLANPVKQYGSVVIVSSYEQLAEIIREHKMFSFAFIQRKQGSHPNPITTTIAGVYSLAAACTACILPVWYPNDFTVDNRIFYCANDNFGPLQSSFFVYQKGYRTRADSFVGCSWFILPRLRKYTKKHTDEMDMQSIANEGYYAYDSKVIEDMVSALREKTTGALPRFSLNNDQFGRLVHDAFGTEYDPDKSYIFRPKKNWSHVAPPESIGKDYKKGHLYARYNKIKSLTYSVSGDTGNAVYNYDEETVDLGDIRNMGPALITWIHTRGK